MNQIVAPKGTYRKIKGNLRRSRGAKVFPCRNERVLSRQQDGREKASEPPSSRAQLSRISLWLSFFCVLRPVFFFFVYISFSIQLGPNVFRDFVIQDIVLEFNASIQFTDR